MSLSLPESWREAGRKLPLGFLGMLLLVLLAESYIARNNLKFSRLEAEDWSTTARIAQGELPLGGIFFFGDSQVKFGVSPLLLESRTGQPSHCLAVQGGQAPTTYFLLKKTLDSGVIPSALVVDFEPHLLRDSIDHNKRMWAELVNWDEALELCWTEGDSGRFGSIAMGKILPSVREKDEIRVNIMTALRGETPGMAAWLEMAARNRGMNRGALAMAKEQHGAIDTTRWGQPTDQPWAPDRVNDVYARKFLQLAFDNKIPVYCMLMPVAPGIQANYEKNGMDRYYFAWLRQLQQQYGNLYVLDWRHSGYQEPVFTDGMHLDMEGALSITAALGEYLQRSFRGEGGAIAVEDSNRSNAFMQSTATRRR
jgi:hypothetical protein